MEFYSAYNPCKTIPAPTGDGTEPVFEMKVLKNGVKELVEVGRTNVYDLIQAHKDECDVYKILERYDNGDLSVLDRAKGQFGDFTQFPKSLAEAQQQVIDAETMFYKLPVEVRKEFDHSYTKFLASFSDGSYKEIFDKYIPKEEPVDSAVSSRPEQNGGVINE